MWFYFKIGPMSVFFFTVHCLQLVISGEAMKWTVGQIPCVYMICNLKHSSVTFSHHLSFTPSVRLQREMATLWIRSLAFEFITWRRKERWLLSGVAYLAYRDPAEAGVQHPGDCIGTHFTHERELLPPTNTVLLHLLPAHTRTHTHSLEREYMFTDIWLSSSYSFILRCHLLHLMQAKRYGC